jgi:hypothetical protein
LDKDIPQVNQSRRRFLLGMGSAGAAAVRPFRETADVPRQLGGQQEAWKLTARASASS